MPPVFASIAAPAVEGLWRATASLGQHSLIVSLAKSAKTGIKSAHFGPPETDALDYVPQDTVMSSMTDRITFNPKQCGGKPCIRGMRIRVSDVLDMLAGGATRADILRDFPYLENDDITAALQYAAAASRGHTVIAAE